MQKKSVLFCPKKNIQHKFSFDAKLFSLATCDLTRKFAKGFSHCNILFNITAYMSWINSLLRILSKIRIAKTSVIYNILKSESDVTLVYKNKWTCGKVSINRRNDRKLKSTQH